MSKNYDPKMHSAEHMLNQAMVSKFKCSRCFSAHINKKKSKCDYYFDRPLTGSEITEIQATVNKEIDKNHPVIVEMVSKENAQTRFNLDRVSGKDGLNELRIVTIGAYDACPCIGPHVKTTKEIGHFKITSSGFENGVLRIRFKLIES